jgi:hypothetical protein
MTLEKQEEIRQLRLKNAATTNEFLGATVKDLRVVWWPPIEDQLGQDDVITAVCPPGRFWAGVRLWDRGLHWDRRARYGEN